ncbi:MAG: iron complex outermembrane receptor protein [Candidatus Azotimanducaceae bacterium]|jgi:iron complex outermembrane receptor protein
MCEKKFNIIETNFRGKVNLKYPNPTTLLSSKRSVLRTLTVFSTLAAFTIPTLSYAEIDDIDANMEVVTVVARNVEESLQDVPVAVTTIGEKAMTMFRIDEATDLISRVPALNVSVGGSGAGAQITLRGVGSSSISNAFDSAVALNYDGISVSTQRLLQSAFFDVEQIAVLKGPQSLYFGKAASAGVLSLRSANPTDDWEYGAKTSYERQEEGTTFGGYVSGPISDTLGVRVALEHQDIDKFVEIADGNPTPRPERGLENLISRVTFNWEPTDDLAANLKLNYNRQRSESLNSNLDIFCGAGGAEGFVLLGGAFGVPGLDLFEPTHDCDIYDGKFVGPDGDARINSVPTGSPGEGRNIALAYNDTDTFFARLQVDYSISDSLDLTTLIGYVDLDNEYNDTFNSTGQNLDGSAAGLPAPFLNTLKQTTFEVRLASNFDGAFNYQIGVFWEDRDIDHKTSQNAFNPTLLEALGGPPGPANPFGPDSATGFTFDWLADRPLKAEALSVFASAQYQLSERWELSGGVRWTDEEKSTSIGFPFIHGGVVALGLTAISSGFQTGDVDFEDDNISPELVLSYRVNDDISIYGAYKTGFKSGGIDNNTLPTGNLVLNLNDPDPAVREASGDVLRFESEESKGGEIGFRSLLLDRALTLNLTAFNYVFKNQQVQNFDPVIFGFDTTNAGELTTRGLDVDFMWSTPISGLSVSGSWAFLDTELTGDLILASGENLKGQDGGFSPDFSGNIAIIWETRINDSFLLQISPNIAYKSDFNVGAGLDEFDAVTNPTGYLVQDSYTQVDLNVSLYLPGEKWRVSLIARNLADEQYLTFAGPAPFRPATGDDQLVGLGRGRQIFAELAYNF